MLRQRSSPCRVVVVTQAVDGHGAWTNAGACRPPSTHGAVARSNSSMPLSGSGRLISRDSRSGLGLRASRPAP
eukprot:15145756-Alexandrium_andersonii.AAC.1